MRYRPMLATAGSVGDVRDGFLYEFKWDGVRALVEVGVDGRVHLFSRSGTEITDRYPELLAIGEAVGRSVVLDAEVVALGENGRPSFGALQGRMHLSDPARVAQAARRRPVVLIAFDLLELDGEPLIDLPYTARRARLADLGIDGPRFQVPRHHDTDLDVLLQAAAANGLEGVVAKRPDSPYRPGRRSDDWRKVRLVRRQEFVVGGYARGDGARTGTFGSLLLGYHDPAGHLRYAGSVGTGFTDEVTRRLQAVLDPLARDTSPYAGDVRKRGDLVFVEPVLVVEVQFSEWTADGLLRQPSFKGVRPDKRPGEVVYVPGTPEGPPVRDTGR